MLKIDELFSIQNLVSLLESKSDGMNPGDLSFFHYNRAILSP